MVLIVSDHPLVFDNIRGSFEADFDVLTMVPHAESVIAAADVLAPEAVIVDLSRRSVRSAAVTARLLDEVPDVRLVVLMDVEANPDVKRRVWLERGLEQEALGPELARSLRNAFGGKVRAFSVEASDQDLLAGPTSEAFYSPTFNC
jgi:DNA-binding NarL/FixJ family response regulator